MAINNMNMKFGIKIPKQTQVTPQSGTKPSKCRSSCCCGKAITDHAQGMGWVIWVSLSGLAARRVGRYS